MVLTKKFSDFVEVADPSNSDETVGLAGGQNSRFPLGITPSTLEWELASNTIQIMSSNFGYITDNAGLINFTLPLLCDIGERIAISGFSAGGWSLDFNVGQTVIVGGIVATPSFGSIASTDRYDQIELLCVETNTTFIARSLIGTLTIV
jgi:hypothetical protein